jgi:hypothetical protein
MLWPIFPIKKAVISDKNAIFSPLFAEIIFKNHYIGTWGQCYFIYRYHGTSIRPFSS